MPEPQFRPRTAVPVMTYDEIADELEYRRKQNPDVFGKMGVQEYSTRMNTLGPEDRDYSEGVKTTGLLGLIRPVERAVHGTLERTAIPYGFSQLGKLIGGSISPKLEEPSERFAEGLPRMLTVASQGIVPLALSSFSETYAGTGSLGAASIAGGSALAFPRAGELGQNLLSKVLPKAAPLTPAYQQAIKAATPFARPTELGQISERVLEFTGRNVGYAANMEAAKAATALVMKEKYSPTSPENLADLTVNMLGMAAFPGHFRGLVRGPVIGGKLVEGKQVGGTQFSSFSELNRHNEAMRKAQDLVKSEEQDMLDARLKTEDNIPANKVALEKTAAESAVKEGMVDPATGNLNPPVSVVDPTQTIGGVPKGQTPSEGVAKQKISAEEQILSPVAEEILAESAVGTPLFFGPKHQQAAINEGIPIGKKTIGEFVEALRVKKQEKQAANQVPVQPAQSGAEQPAVLSQPPQPKIFTGLPANTWKAIQETGVVSSEEGGVTTPASVKQVMQQAGILPRFVPKSFDSLLDIMQAAVPAFKNLKVFISNTPETEKALFAMESFQGHEQIPSKFMVDSEGTPIIYINKNIFSKDPITAVMHMFEESGHFFHASMSEVGKAEVSRIFNEFKKNNPEEAEKFREGYSRGWEQAGEESPVKPSKTRTQEQADSMLEAEWVGEQFVKFLKDGTPLDKTLTASEKFMKEVKAFLNRFKGFVGIMKTEEDLVAGAKGVYGEISPSEQLARVIQQEVAVGKELVGGRGTEAQTETRFAAPERQTEESVAKDLEVVRDELVTASQMPLNNEQASIAMMRVFDKSLEVIKSFYKVHAGYDRETFEKVIDTFGLQEGLSDAKLKSIFKDFHEDLTKNFSGTPNEAYVRMNNYFIGIGEQLKVIIDGAVKRYAASRELPAEKHYKTEDVQEQHRAALEKLGQLSPDQLQGYQEVIHDVLTKGIFGKIPAGAEATVQGSIDVAATSENIFQATKTNKELFKKQVFALAKDKITTAIWHEKTRGAMSLKPEILGDQDMFPTVLEQLTGEAVKQKEKPGLVKTAEDQTAVEVSKLGREELSANELNSFGKVVNALKSFPDFEKLYWQARATLGMEKPRGDIKVRRAVPAMQAFIDLLQATPGVRVHTEFDSATKKMTQKRVAALEDLPQEVKSAFTDVLGYPNFGATKARRDELSLVLKKMVELAGPELKEEAGLVKGEAGRLEEQGAARQLFAAPEVKSLEVQRQEQIKNELIKRGLEPTFVSYLTNFAANQKVTYIPSNLPSELAKLYNSRQLSGIDKQHETMYLDTVKYLNSFDEYGKQKVFEQMFLAGLSGLKTEDAARKALRGNTTEEALENVLSTLGEKLLVDKWTATSLHDFIKPDAIPLSGFIRSYFSTLGHVLTAVKDLDVSAPTKEKQQVAKAAELSTALGKITKEMIESREGIVRIIEALTPASHSASPEIKKNVPEFLQEATRLLAIPMTDKEFENKKKSPVMPLWGIDKLLPMAQLAELVPAARYVYQKIADVKKAGNSLYIRMVTPVLATSKGGKTGITNKNIVDFMREHPRLKGVLSDMRRQMNDLVAEGKEVPEDFVERFKKGLSPELAANLDLANNFISGIGEQGWRSLTNGAFSSTSNDLAKMLMAKDRRLSADNAGRRADAFVDAAFRQLNKSALPVELDALRANAANGLQPETVKMALEYAESLVPKLQELVDLSSKAPYFSSEQRTGRYLVTWRRYTGEVGPDGKPETEVFAPPGTDHLSDLKKIQARAEQDNDLVPDSIKTTDRQAPFRQYGGLSRDVLNRFIALEKIKLDAALKHLPPEVAEEFRSQYNLGDAILQEAKNPKLGVFTKKRKFVGGREELDILESAIEYAKNLSFALAKQEGRELASLGMKDPEVLADPRLRQWLSDYVSTSLNPPTPEYVKAKTSGAAYYMAFNWLQPIIEMSQSVQTLAGHFTSKGFGIGQGLKEITKAGTDLGTAWLKSKGDSPMLEGIELAFWNRARREGLFSETLHDEYNINEDGSVLKLLDAVKTGDAGSFKSNAGNKLLWGLRMGMKPVTVASHANSMIGWLAGFRLAMSKKGMTPEEAYEFAKESLPTGLYTGGITNRPAWMYGTGRLYGAVGVWNTLQGYTFSTVGMMYRLGVNSINRGNLTPRERMDSRKALGQMLMTNVLLAGAMGALPGVAGLIALLEQNTDVKANEAIRDWTHDFEKEDNALGNLVGDTVMSGLPTALMPRDWGIDLSQRIGLGSILGLNTYKGFDLQGFAGPTGSIIKNMLFDAPRELLLNRDPHKALQAMVPASLKHMVELYRNDGEFRDNKGRLLFEPNTAQKFMYAIGGQPKELTELRKAQNMMERSDRIATKQRHQWYDSLAERLIKGDFEYVRAALLEKEQSDPHFDSRPALSAVVQLAQDKVNPIDLLSQAASSDKQGRAAIAATFPLRPRQSEVAKLMQRQQMERSVRIPGAGMLTPRSLGRAQLIDKLIQQYPTMTRPEAVSVAEKLGM